MYRAPFIRVLFANEWETTTLKHPVRQEQLDPRRRVTPEMNIPHGKKTPRRGRRIIAQDKRSAVLGTSPKISLAPCRGAVKWPVFIGSGAQRSRRICGSFARTINRSSRRDESRIAQDQGPQRQVFVAGVEEKRSALLGAHPPTSPRVPQGRGDLAPRIDLWKATIQWQTSYSNSGWTKFPPA